ncbi:MAG: photosystem II S4 domain protein [Oscillatoriales cyanobacterium SM2_2_1]|nr:photosystem II S4 domain protein [Oscillatoriales cyanobacterium SM2_2_1]
MSGLPRTILSHTEHRETLSRLLDLGDRALTTWEVTWSDFLTPPELAEAIRWVQPLGEIHLLAWGGYEQAERVRVAIARSELPLDPSVVPLAAIEISGNFLFDPASHRDFLGSMLGAGIERHKVGDLVGIGERGAQAFVVPELVDYLTLHLTQVRTVPVKTRAIDLTELKIRPPQIKEITTTEASLRLDAIASAGFGVARSKMVELIQADQVRVNWKSVTQPSHHLNTGDLVVIRGKGRLLIGDILITKKERFRIQLTRYS